jgi:phage tail-like protein
MAGELPFIAFNFSVELQVANAGALGLANPLCSAEFAECDGLEMTMEPKTVREGGANTRVRHLPGPLAFGTLTLKRGMTADLGLWTWFAAAAGNAHRGTLAQGVVLMRSAAGDATTLRFRLQDCLPVKIKAPALNAAAGLVAVEEMQIAYGALAIEPG